MESSGDSEITENKEFLESLRFNQNRRDPKLEMPLQHLQTHSTRLSRRRPDDTDDGRRMTAGMFLPPLAAVALLLGGCASTRVTNIVRMSETTTSEAMPAPRRILVQPIVDDQVPHSGRETFRAVASSLEADVIKRLRRAGLVALPYRPEIASAGDLIMRMSVTRVDNGNMVERILIGFGFGRASLSVTTSLSSVSAEVPMLAFDSTSRTGRKPGLILPGGLALATGKSVSLALTAVQVGLGLSDDLDKGVHRTGAALVKQVRTHYAAAHWRWPADGQH